MSNTDPEVFKVQTIEAYQCQNCNLLNAVNSSHIVANIKIDIKKHPSRLGGEYKDKVFCCERCLVTFIATQLGVEYMLNKTYI